MSCFADHPYSARACYRAPVSAIAIAIVFSLSGLGFAPRARAQERAGLEEPAPAAPQAAKDEIIVRNDVEYARRGESSLALDLAYPKPGDLPRPVVVCIHGGGWKGGHRRGYRGLVRSLAESGYVAATVSYRFSQDAPFPAQREDVRDALRWIRAHASELGADPARVGVTGESAGGHLSLLLGVESDEESAPETSVQAVANYFGPTDLRHPERWLPQCRELLESLGGGDYATKKQVFWDASPVVHVSTGDAPVLSFHGTADAIVPHQQATMLHRELDRARVPNELVILEGEDHGWGGETRAATTARSRRFFDLYLRSGPADLPLLVAEDFESGSERWETTAPATWKLGGKDGARYFSLSQKTNDYQPPVRSPYHIALLKGTEVGDFVLDVRLRSTIPDYGHRDLCLFFGHQSPSRFYYVHLGKVGDDHANSIFLVNDAARVSIARERSTGIDWDDAWHRVRIVREADSGLIEVFFDDFSVPVMATRDRTFLSGRVGFGSFDDTGDFTEVRLFGRLKGRTESGARGE